MTPPRKIRVLIVDDSAAVRQVLKEVLEMDPGIEVMATACDPYAAVARIQKETPDVITLDIEMPRMDGLTFLKKIMNQHPIPVVICSSLTEKGSDSAMAALEFGAVEIITKPRLGTRQFFQESRIRICDAVKAAAAVRSKQHRMPAPAMAPAPRLNADAILARPSRQAMIETTERVVVVGASTGGTEALRNLFMDLPSDAPGIVVVQHMPEKFTANFAARLNSLSRISVKEAAGGDAVIPGHALIAPGNRHLILKRSGARYFVEVRDGPLVSRHRPSVDVLFRSTARYAGRNALGIILTGMGDDGARGLREMRDAGAIGIAQDESSCVVFGMPQEAIKAGGVDRVLPLDRIAAEIMKVRR